MAGDSQVVVISGILFRLWPLWETFEYGVNWVKSAVFQKGTVTLLINGKQVAQKSIDFPLKGSLGLFAGGDSIVEARSFRVDKVIFWWSYPAMHGGCADGAGSFFLYIHCSKCESPWQKMFRKISLRISWTLGRCLKRDRNGDEGKEQASQDKHKTCHSCQTQRSIAANLL